MIRINARPSRIVYGLVFSIFLLGALCAAEHAAITMEQLKNLDYRGIYEQPISLKNGVYEGEPFVQGGASRPSAQLVDEPFLIMDLDGDGIDEAVVLITENSGGSGVYTYLAVVAWHDNKLQNVAALRLGDRVQVRSLDFEGNSLAMQLLVAGRGEPLCCPTQKLRNLYSFQSRELIQVASEETGQLSIADLEGTIWKLSHFSREQTLPQGIEVILAFSDGRVSGKSGCNRYFGGVNSSAPGGINFSPMGATMMACASSIMEVEQKYLRALEKVKRFGFQNGRLILGYKQDGIWEALLFTSSD